MTNQQLQLEQLQPGDIIYAATDIYNDGSIPDMPEKQILAGAGTRGVLINTGHLQENASQAIYLVRFENGKSGLSPAIGCWPQELAGTPD